MTFPLACLAVLTAVFASGAPAPAVLRVAPPVPACDWDTGAMRTFTNATELIQGAIDEAFRAGGGTVSVAPGLYSIRGIRLRGGVTLHLEAGAVLTASRDSSDFNVLDHDPLEPVDPAAGADDKEALWRRSRAVIRLHRADGAAIVGEPGAVIDGCNGFDPEGEEGYRGVHAIHASDSANLVFRGFTVRHAGNYAMRITRCRDLAVENVTALAGHDGVHLRACRRARVENCVLHTGDDCVAGYGNEDIVVRGCDLSSACSALRLGGCGILVEKCHAHGPCEYVFRGSLTPQAKRDGLWDPAVVPGRHSMATFFLYYSDTGIPVSHVPGEIVLRDCKVENAARLVRYNQGGERWQRGRPLSSLTLERVEAGGLTLPVALNGGIGENKGEWPLDFAMRDCSLSFARTPDEVFSTANVRSMALDGVSVKCEPPAAIPLIRSWDGSVPELSLQNVTGASPEPAFGEGPYSCPMRGNP
ncbi:MAG: right-handed parallel beta-helix repeat-containing protein [Kiritimatiellae bacterium]|nr:right-handed parallel beta-helix repeat-containing protein [Kiritimatiellia bacterium]